MSDDDARLKMAQTYAAVFDTVNGRAVLEDLRVSFGDRRSFVEGDPHSTAFREGQRDVYLAILDLLDVSTNPQRRHLVVVGPEEAA